MSGGPLWGGGDSEENRVLPTAVRYLTTSLPQLKEGQMHTQMCIQGKPDSQCHRQTLVLPSCN